MAIDPREVSQLKSELSRAARSASAPEVAAFAARLKDVSLASIRQKLASRAIGRPWKRDLAEAEIERRTVAEPAGDDDQISDIVETTAGKPPIPSWARWIAAAVIAVSLAVTIYTVLTIWMA